MTNDKRPDIGDQLGQPCPLPASGGDGWGDAKTIGVAIIMLLVVGPILAINYFVGEGEWWARLVSGALVFISVIGGFITLGFIFTPKSFFNFIFRCCLSFGLWYAWIAIFKAITASIGIERNPLW